MIPALLLLKILLIMLVLLISVFVLRFLILLSATSKLDSISRTFAREYSVGSPNDPPLRYIAIGYSTVQGTGCDRVEETLPYAIALDLSRQKRYVQVINLGKSGAKIKDVRMEQVPKLSSLNADVISLNVGANDTTHFTSFQNYKQDMTSILSSIAPTRLLVANTPDMQGIPALPWLFGRVTARRAIRQNEILNEITIVQKTAVIDLYRNGKLPNIHHYAPDLFHPNAAGYAQWSALYLKSS